MPDDAYDPEEQLIIDTVVDLAADTVVTMFLKMIDTEAFVALVKAAGVQHQKQVRDRALDEIIDRLTNLRQGDAL